MHAVQTHNRFRPGRDTAKAPFDKETWKRIFGTVYTEGEAYSMLRELCDTIGPRMSCTEGGRRAEEYVHGKFKQWGLDRVHYEPFRMLSWERGDLKVDLLAPHKRSIPAIALGYTPSSSPRGLEAGVCTVGYGTPDEFRHHAAEIKGRIALCMNGAPPGHRNVHRTEKMALAHRYGAVAMVLINSTPGNVPQAGTAAFAKIAPLVGISVSREEGEWLCRLIREGSEVKLFIRSSTRHGDGKARNIVADITGSAAPDEIVILGAHLDSWDLAQGAIDNGIGNATLLEAARILSSLKQRPPRTIRFVLFMGEEFGLNGSKAYLRTHAGELAKTVMMMNLDMAGRPNGYKLFACDEAAPFFTRLGRELKHAGMTDPVEIKGGLHSDHQPFMLSGVPACQPNGILDDEQLKYYHSAGDTFDKVREDYLNPCAAVSAITLWELARVPQRPAPHLKPETVRGRMIRDGVQEALILGGEWPWPVNRKNAKTGRSPARMIQ